ncbi:hypothetical protein D6817_02335 [Candidatus Pacearchaeota archaeon]|nr:MAG: hypothetical protein D6817_02335 [Candidatus Pacearchaeota archaeon]
MAKVRGLLAVGAVACASYLGGGCPFASLPMQQGEQQEPSLHEFYREALSDAVGDYDAIVGICGHDLWCLQEASRLNPDLRGQICDLVERTARESYAGRLSAERLEEFVEGHRQQCELGLGAFDF